MKHTLKAHGSERLKLTTTCDKLLSSFAFNFDLRRYIKENPNVTFSANASDGSTDEQKIEADDQPNDYLISMVGSVVSELDSESNGALFEAAEKMDNETASNSGRMAAAAASRRLLGGGGSDDGNKTAADYAADFGEAMNLSMEDLKTLFPTLSGSVKVVVKAIVDKGHKASDEQLVILSALDLCAVALRAAPKPLGMGSEDVFSTAWGALMVGMHTRGATLVHFQLNLSRFCHRQLDSTQRNLSRRKKVLTFSRKVDESPASGPYLTAVLPAVNVDTLLALLAGEGRTC